MLHELLVVLSGVVDGGIFRPVYANDLIEDVGKDDDGTESGDYERVVGEVVVVGGDADARGAPFEDRDRPDSTQTRQPLGHGASQPTSTSSRNMSIAAMLTSPSPLPSTRPPSSRMTAATAYNPSPPCSPPPPSRADRHQDCRSSQTLVGLTIPDDFPFLSSSDRTAFTSLATLGVLFHRILTCLDTLRSLSLDRPLLAVPSLGRDCQSSSPVPVVIGGSYALCLATAVNDGVVAEYRATIIEVESKVLDPTDGDTRGGAVPVSLLVRRFSKFARVFPTLLEFLDGLCLDPPRQHGMQILDALHTLRITGNLEAKQVWESLFHACTAVFMKQLTAWMIHGVVADPCREFFVVATGRTSSRTTKWDSLYELDRKMVPRMITEKLLEKIVFVGKAVAAIKQSKGDLEQTMGSFVQANGAHLTSLYHSKSFRVLDLEVAVDKIKRSVATILWSVVVVEQELGCHLEACRNYFLLGQGDFFAVFLDECEALKSSAALQLLNVTEHDLAQLTHRAARKSSAVSDPALKRFRFVNEDTAAGTAHASAAVGVPIRLQYSVQWPLDLILTADDLAIYNQIFLFLLDLRRIQMRLHRIWTLTSTASRSMRRSTSEFPNEMWRLRGAMMFFIDNLWSYVQMDVIAVSYHKLISHLTPPEIPMNAKNLEKATKVAATFYGEEDVVSTKAPSSFPRRSCSFLDTHGDKSTNEKNTNRTNNNNFGDFDSLQRAHGSFLASCYAGCFLEGNGASAQAVCSGSSTSAAIMAAAAGLGRFVAPSLRGAMTSCERFCGVVERAVRDADGVGGHPEWYATEIRRLKEEFDQHTSFLFRIFSGAKETAAAAVAGGGGQHALDALLLRLDHNLFYSLGLET
ncbi:Spc98 family-domain-containing protein [Zopfochytrium polystomum]|nr:Spc98 family-domain-containing protein [Zopfochytrium polystomum]KAI9336237.1 Spc98 family-domain-containing protein [Zopfochytrium polystomum]